MTGTDEDSGFDLKRDLVHRDISQLLFQVSEIVDDRTYLQHGVEVGPDDVVVDVGANVGVAAAFFAGICEVGEVHSFEPIPQNYELLLQNVSKLPAVRTYPFGLSDRARTETFTYYEGAAAMSSAYADPERDRDLVGTVLADLGLSQEEIAARLDESFEPVSVECELRPLSAVIDERGIAAIDLLKIDVERAELDVLAGIEERHWPLVRQVVAEVHDEGGGLQRARTELASRGFSVVVDQDERMRRTGVFVVYARR
ncbi:MAG: FkbM family methyltransferase [Solirubrobacterales bacterium]|nr:FkbM family methyltransferase [Solirubrobacterales bacterium]